MLITKYSISSHYITRYRNQKRQYRILYNYIDDNGIYHRGKTGWHNSRKEGKRQAMANIVKSTNTKTKDSDITLRKAFDKFLKYRDDLLDEKKNAIGQKNATRTTQTEYNTAKKYNREMKTLYSKYMPKELAKIKLKDLDETFLASWFDDLKRLDISPDRTNQYRGKLIIFNEFLRINNYITKSFSLDALKMLEMIKPKSKNDFSSRQLAKQKVDDEGFVIEDKYPTEEDIEKIRKYYENDFGHYDSFYWYCLFNVAFYTGVRPSELVALKWKNVDFAKCELRIRDAITTEENRKDAEIRKEQGKASTKTSDAPRDLPMFVNYLFLLEDFYLYTKYYFNWTDKEMQNKYVFQNITGLNNYDYEATSTRNISRELARILPKLDIEKFTTAKFRHGCAHWLVEKMNFDYDGARKYFGHKDSSRMLEEIYNKLDKRKVRSNLEKNKNTKSMIVDKSLLNITANDTITTNQKTKVQKIIEARYGRMYKEFLEKKKEGIKTTFHIFQFDKDNTKYLNKKNYYHPEIEYIEYFVDKDLIPNKNAILKYFLDEEKKKEQ